MVQVWCRVKRTIGRSSAPAHCSARSTWRGDRRNTDGIRPVRGRFLLDHGAPQVPEQIAEAVGRPLDWTTSCLLNAILGRFAG
jgi:hypothetical protein